MLAPLSWLKDFVKITLPTDDLAWRLTESGLGVESIKKMGGEEILELEITPNRPDLLSIVGIAREIATIENRKINLKSIILPKPVNHLPLKVVNDFTLFARYTALIIDNIKIKPSPKWLHDRLIQLGLRPINNIVDITNYVMFELGIPLHAFDYEEIKGHEINVLKAKGGESFTSVDELRYKLPAGAIIIKDSQRIIDLCGIKGGQNSGIKNSTKTVMIQVTADDPLLIRRASQALSLRSDASTIFERGVDKGGLTYSLKRAAQLIIEHAEGQLASDIIDLSKHQFIPWKLTLSLEKLEKVLGIRIPLKTVLSILTSLSLNPICKGNLITVTIPTYREDLKKEEDLIEEVARVYGYNKFPLTLPSGQIPVKKVAYAKDFREENKVRQFLVAAGYNEIYTYSLVSKNLLIKLNLPDSDVIRIANPVSIEYEYLRPTLVGNILQAIKQNLPYFTDIDLFELGRLYKGIPPNTKEGLSLVIATTKQFEKLKGTVEELLNRLHINHIRFSPLKESAMPKELAFLLLTKTANILARDKEIGFIGEINRTVASNFGLENPPIICQIDFESIQYFCRETQFVPIPSFPALIEDLALIIPPKTYVGQIIEEIKNISPLIQNVALFDYYGNTKTFRLTYQNTTRTLSTQEVKVIREKILQILKSKFRVTLKQ